MKKMHIFISIILLICSFSLLVISAKDEKSSEDAPISLQNETLNFDENGEEINLTDDVNTNDGYYYQKMSNQMQLVYDEMYEGILNRKEKINISPLNEELFKKVFYALTFDNPEIIQLSDDYTYDLREGYVIKFYPTYTISKKEYSQRIKEINNEVLKIQTATKDLSNYEKELYIHDYLLKKCVYASEGDNIINIYGALIEGKANCRGYSAAFSYLLNSCGVISGQLIGTTVKNDVIEGHSWNFVILDDEYYYCDVCWNDIAPSSDYSDVDYHYAFFNMTYDEISKTHNFSNQEKYLYKITDSNDGKYSFVKSNGLYAYTYEDACDIINNKLPYAIKTNKKYFMIQCDSKEIYDNLCNNITDIIKQLIKNGDTDIKHCTYIKIDSGNMIIIHDFVK